MGTCEELKRYLAYLDEINDFLDEEDELAGIPMVVGDAWEVLESFLLELYMLRKNDKT